MSRLATISFDRAIDSIAKPLLEANGFKQNGRRKFLSNKQGVCFGFEFQLGQRVQADSFTVNVLAGDTVERLGFLRRNLGSAIVKLLGLRNQSLLSRILSPGDKWWPVSAWDKETSQSMNKSCKMIEKFGIPWLELEMNRIFNGMIKHDDA